MALGSSQYRAIVPSAHRGAEGAYGDEDEYEYEGESKDSDLN